MIKIKILIIWLFAIFISSCTLIEADLFDLSPTERINKPLKDITAQLQQAKNGWALEYFATETSQGYTLLIKFNTNGQAFVAGKNDQTRNYLLTDSCFYKMVADDGPVLTFNTFNKIIHAFSNPENPNGIGLGGDYEFIVMKAEATQLTLIGKKNGAHILLNKLDESISWNQYFSNLENMHNLLFGNSIQALKLKTTTDEYLFNGGKYHIFSYLETGENTMNSQTASFLITQNGIRFQTPLKISGFTVQTLQLNSDKSALVSLENPDFKLNGPDSLSTFFSQNTNCFLMDTTTMSPALKTLAQKIVKSCISNYNADKVWFRIQFQPALNVFGLAVNFSIGRNKFVGKLALKCTVNSINQLTFSAGNSLDYNGSEFLSSLNGLSEFRNSLAQQYKLSTNIPINPTNIRFEQSANSAFWFTLDASVK